MVLPRLLASVQDVEVFVLVDQDGGLSFSVLLLRLLFSQLPGFPRCDAAALAPRILQGGSTFRGVGCNGAMDEAIDLVGVCGLQVSPEAGHHFHQGVVPIARSAQGNAGL